MRHRVEDLGRLCVYLEEILEGPLFNNDLNKYNFTEHFMPVRADQEEMQQQYVERLDEMRRNIEMTSETLYKCLAVAQGLDDLNTEEAVNLE